METATKCHETPFKTLKTIEHIEYSDGSDESKEAFRLLSGSRCRLRTGRLKLELTDQAAGYIKAGEKPTQVVQGSR